MRGNLRRGLSLVRRRTPRGEPIHVRFYEKAGCGLCDEAHRALTRVRMSVPIVIERIDIERDAALFDRYAIRIPVVAVGERELDAAGLDDVTLRDWLGELIAGR